MDAEFPSGGEAQISNSGRKRGGWITFPFIAGTLIGLTVAVPGWSANLAVYFIEIFHVKQILATQIVNVVSGFTSVFPIVGAIIADSLLGCYSVIWIFSVISLMGTILLFLTATLDSLKPQPCETAQFILCRTPTKIQFVVLYAGIALAAIGMGGTRFIIAAMGANQFDKVSDQGIFFNWYAVVLYTSTLVGVTAIVYVEDNVSWALGFGVCVVTTFVGLVIFLIGNRYYQHVKPQGSPFTGLCRVLVAAIRKRKVPSSARSHDYYFGQNEIEEMVVAPNKSFRFLNRAAVKMEGDTKSDGSIAKPWRLCSVQEVEDLKSLIKISPILSSGIFLNVPIGVTISLTILQALTMNRHIGPHFQIPPGSMIIFIAISAIISLTIIDRIIYPTCQKMIRRTPTLFQRIGVGHVFNAAAVAVAALVESKRLKKAQTHTQAYHLDPMGVLWLVPQLALIGLGEAFHYPGQVTFCYQEFPKSVKSTATAMISLVMGISHYLGTALIDVIQRKSKWLPDDINHGRLDNVYWTLVVLGVLNFGFFLTCTRFYKYQNQNVGTK